MSHVICIALMSDEVKHFHQCSLAKATGSCEYGSLDTAAFIVRLSAAFISRQSWPSYHWSLRMGLHSVGKPSK